ncbi:hypothetical protein [Clostridium perfringens]|uniref:hypothetical protein n=1 Tax=Clostridium perfringens TaxID=1502 RepID=UPI003CF1ECF1
MNNETIKKINEEIINTKVNLTIKDFEIIIRELEDKDREIRELKKLTDGLENQLWEFEEDYDDLEEENTKLKKEKENLEDECFELEEENNKLTAELKEVKSENMKLKMEKIAKKIQESDIKLSEDLAKYIANAGLISLKSCLNSMNSLEK